MELISGLMNTPKSQSAEEVIPTLCDRLSHASLASDKRAAILTLKGFSREYRESVIANGLRGLINTLKAFTIDTELIKACLETLLILFIRGEGDDDMTRSWISQQSRVQNGKYPSPLLMKEENNTIDQFSLWIADEITQEDGTISLILSLLENTDFYIRMYTLQLLEALVSVRPLRAKEAILHAPLGISSLIQTLEDVHDPVRNEAVLLLMAICNDNFNIQKLVAFENTFDRLFEIIHEEGDIRGSIVVQDCLSLIANLLKYNVSNQNLFLETNCLPKLAFLISEPLSSDEIIWNDQRLQNVIIALDIVRLFVLEGNESTKQNQNNFYNADIFIHVLRLSFSEFAPNSLRAIALLTTADMIAGNVDLQYKFSSIDVPYIDPSLPQQLQKHSGDLPVIIALLNWCLFVNSVHLFDIRAAAAHLLHAYFKDNKDAKREFVQDQITTYSSSDEDESDEPNEEDKNKSASPKKSDEHQPNDESNGNSTTGGSSTSKPQLNSVPAANLFQSLLEYDPENRLNPYKIWFSSVILLYLFEDDQDIKETVRGITTGNEEAGEEVLTSIEAMSDVMVTTLNSQDPRISVGYMMVLITWLYEDLNAVNDFLKETSTIKALMSFLKQPTADSGIVQGLITVLIGVAYEFSSKESPIPRVELHCLISKMIGKDNFSLKIRQFKESEYFSEFNEEAIYNPKKDESGLPEVFFDPILVHLLKENFNRIKNSLNKDPSIESNGRISYEKFEELQDKFYGLKHNFEELESKSKSSNEELKTSLKTREYELKVSTDAYKIAKDELSALKETHWNITEDFNRVREELEGLQKSHKEISERSTKQQRDLEESSGSLTSKESEISRLKKQLDQTTKQKQKADEGINKMSRELFLLSKEKDEGQRIIQQLEKELQSSTNQLKITQDSLGQKIEDTKMLKARLDSVDAENRTLKSQKLQVEKELDEAKSQYGQSSALVNQLSEKLGGLTNTCNSLTAEKSELEMNVADIQRSSSIELASLNSKLEELTEVNAELYANKAKLSQEIKGGKKTLDEYQEKLKTTVSKYEDHHRILQERYSALEKDLAETKSANADLQKTLQDAQASVDKFQKNESEKEAAFAIQEKRFNEKRSELEKNTETLIERHKEFQKKVDDAHDAKVTLDKELITHKDNLFYSQETLKAKEKEIDALNAKIMKLEAESKDHDNIKSKLKAELDSAKTVLKQEKTLSAQKLEELTKSKQDMEVELDDLAVELETKEHNYKKEITALKEKVGSLEQEKKSLESTLEMISQNIEAKAKEAEALSKDLKTKKSDTDKITNDLKKVQEEKTSVEKLLKEKSDMLEDTNAKLNETNKSLKSCKYELEEKVELVRSLESKLESEEAKHKSQIETVEEEMKALQSDMETKYDDFEKERSLLSNDSTSAIKEYSRKVSKLEAKLQKSEKVFNAKITVLEKEKEKLEETVSELESTIESMKNDCSAKDKNTDEINQKLVQLENEKLESEKSLKQLSIEVDDAKGLKYDVKKLKETIKGLTQQVTEKDSVLKSNSQEIETLSRELISKTSKLNGIEAEISFKKEEVENAYKKLTETEVKLKKELGILEIEKSESVRKLEELSIKLKSSEGDFKKHQRDLENEISELKSKNKADAEQRSKEFSENEKRAENLAEEVEILKKKNITLKDNVKDAENFSGSLKDSELEIEILKKELAELKKSSQADLDDLFLVLNEVDESKKKYKAKAKELGGEVSSDEESDSGEESD